MLTPEERLEVGLRALQRLGPMLRAQKAKREDSAQGSLPRRSPDLPGANRTLPPAPKLSNLIQQLGIPAPGTLVLGLCEDGMPFTMDLGDPAPGSLLVVAGPSAGKTRLLHSILSSIVMANTPGQAVFQVIASHPADFEDLSTVSHCQRFLDASDPAAWNLVADLAALEQQRHQGSRRGPAMVLAIDDLAAFLASASEQDLSNLVSLGFHGPQARIWVLASIEASQLAQADERLMSVFRTRLLGAIPDRNLATTLLGDDSAILEGILPGAQFAAPFDGSWIRFWICNPQ